MDKISTVSWFCIGNVIGLIVLFCGVLFSSQKKHQESDALQKQTTQNQVMQKDAGSDAPR